MLKFVNNFQQIYIKEGFKMGCSDSKTETLPQQTKNNETNAQEKRPKLVQRYTKPSIQAEIDQNSQTKQKRSPQYVTKEEKKIANSKSVPKKDKQNVTKIKKAKELQNKPQHQKFISDIVQKSRVKLAAVIPPAEVSNQGFSKPVVEYSPQKRGDIVSKEYEKDYNKSQWSRPITQNYSQIPNNISLNKSYIAVNQTAKNPYKQKEIQKKLNQIRNQSRHFDKGMKEQDVFNLQLLDSNKTLYL